MMNGGTNPALGGVKDEMVVVKMNMEAMQKNMRQIDLVRIVMYMVAGGMCGWMGLTGMEGFIFYFVVSIVIGVGIGARMGFDVKKYTHPNASLLTLVLGGLGSQIMSFIMFWTLTYSLVFVY